jgi:hypothetical protein
MTFSLLVFTLSYKIFPSLYYKFNVQIVITFLVLFFKIHLLMF